eukprot:gene6350-6417_t
MEWRSEALIIGVRRHGESSAIVELMTPSQGRHLGLVRSGRSKRMQPVLQLGNSVVANWYARLDEHLGTYTLELEQARAAYLMETATGVHGVQWLCAMLRLLAEREAHPALYESALIVADHLSRAEVAAPLMARFELGLLSELGFGLALQECAATGAREELVYVSPKSGRAVSRLAGAPYHDRLFALPEFLKDAQSSPNAQDFADAFRLTGYFMERDIFGPRGFALPDARQGFISCLNRV